MRKKLCSVKQPRLRSIVFKTMFAFALTTLITLSQLDVAAQSVFKKNSSLPQRPEMTGAVWVSIHRKPWFSGGQFIRKTL